MEAKHTPTPWTQLPEECDKPYIRIRGTVLGGRFKIANVLTPFFPGVPDHEAKETRENADFIVRACNAHAALVSALRLARSYMSEAVEYESPCAKRDAETVDAALALAGETP